MKQTDRIRGDVAWVSSRNYEAMIGGAERADLAMIEKAPVEVDMIRPGFDPIEVGRYDKVVVSTLRHFLPEERIALARLRPAVWAHDVEFMGHWLYNTADPLIALTPEHLRREVSHVSPIRTAMNPGHFNTTGMEPGAKEDFALWAHRPIAHKGLDRAQEWSKATGIDLLLMFGAPHDEVIEMMKRSRWFVLMSHVFDPGPWAVIEAQLCGCELVVDNVGYYAEPREALKERIDGAAEAFWAEVLR